jgi:hypothetical protein
MIRGHRRQATHIRRRRDHYRDGVLLRAELITGLTKVPVRLLGRGPKRGGLQTARQVPAPVCVRRIVVAVRETTRHHVLSSDAEVPSGREKRVASERNHRVCRNLGMRRSQMTIPSEKTVTICLGIPVVRQNISPSVARKDIREWRRFDQVRTSKLRWARDDGPYLLKTVKKKRQCRDTQSRGQVGRSCTQFGCTRCMIELSVPDHLASPPLQFL